MLLRISQNGGITVLSKQSFIDGRIMKSNSGPRSPDILWVFHLATTFIYLVSFTKLLIKSPLRIIRQACRQACIPS